MNCGCGNLLKFGEQGHAVFRLNPGSIVLDFDAELVRALGHDANYYPSSLWSKFQGVGEIVIEHLFELGRVEADLADAGIDLFLDHDTLLRRERMQHIA